MRGTLHRHVNKGRLRLLLGLFFLALAIPAGILVYQAFDRLKWEAFYLHQGQAEELAGRIRNRFSELLLAEERRSFTDYSFLVVAGDPAANFLQRSELSGFPVESAIPGLIGYFQVDADGSFSTPLVPDTADAATVGIDDREYRARLELEERILATLSDNRLVEGRQRRLGAEARRSADAMEAPAELELADSETGAGQPPLPAASAPGKDESLKKAEAQVAFERLNEAYRARDTAAPEEEAEAAPRRGEKAELDRVDVTGNRVRQAEPAAAEPEPQAVRSRRKEQSVLPEAQVDLDDQVGYSFSRREDLRVRTFESELDPFELSMLDSGHLVLFRKVWREGERIIQGAVIEQQPFIEGIAGIPFRDTALSTMSNLMVGWQGDVLQAFSGATRGGYQEGSDPLSGSLLYRTRLPAPLDEMELIFTINHLPTGPGAEVIAWTALILAVVLLGGFLALYRLGVGQIELGRQQQDFVSAVSHELKTPLTSIRMYSEMLREGWADEEKRRGYYDYIHDESERLSRLIANVLQLSRLTRNHLQLDRRATRVDELCDIIRSKAGAQAERAGFRLAIECDPEALAATLDVDVDCFAQVVINLVDNAVKFSARAERREIEISCRRDRGNRVVFTVRDFGPGVPADKMKKIFRLFYRPESELTRDTVGTGIGLALVRELVTAMDGTVDVRNRDPGAEFRVSFPAA